jgi:hypothetical protein
MGGKVKDNRAVWPSGDDQQHLLPDLLAGDGITAEGFHLHSERCLHQYAAALSRTEPEEEIGI